MVMMYGKLNLFNNEISLDRGKAMDNKRIAKILYSLSLDMDYADSLEYMDDEIETIAGELELLREINCDCLLQALEVIAGRNEDMEKFYDEIRERN